MTIASLVEQSDEAYIATAFLKSSGLKEIFPILKKCAHSNKIVHIIAGQHFALTEPKALRSLRQLFLAKKNCKLHLAHAHKRSLVFHPKLFLFRKGEHFSILSGSANITEGGLTSNIECSLLLHGSTSDLIWRDAKGYFDHLLSAEMSEVATLLAIRRYETFYEAQKTHNKKTKATPDRSKSQKEFNYLNLKAHFEKFDTTRRKQEFKEKQWHYEEAMKVLNAIADAKKLTQVEFAILLDDLVGEAGEHGWWHSGSMLRLRRDVYPYFQEFQRLVRFIRTNIHLSPSQLFTQAKQIVSGIKGASINYITEIMMTYEPRRFANLNKNPITVLRYEGDVFIKASPESFNGNDYEEYCDLVEEISQELGLQNMLEADSYFNNIYWKIYKKRKR
ncbi:phospholipase D-like domain-containing protein [Pseudobacter ginsenosidimutans]|nr:phospholipase D-like domain-containing protein [Pseudobacter ginsenosidimutans]